MPSGFKDIDRGYNRLRSLARDGDRGTVAFGWLDGPPRDDGLANAQLATIHEYGAPQAGIPAREPVATTVDTHKDEWRRLGSHLMGAVIGGAMTHRQALNLMGLRGVADLKRTIQRGLHPPNTEETIRRKGSSKTLIDTAQLLNSAAHEVRE